MDQDSFNSFMDNYYATKRNQLLNAVQSNRDQMYTFTIDLSSTVLYNQKTYRIDKPFKAISFEDATTPTSYVNVSFDQQGEGKSYKKFKQNAGLSCETMFNGCTIYFPAQTGTISCTIYYDSTYTSGSIINSGGVTITAPTAISVPARIVANENGTTFIPQNTAARFVKFENKSTTDNATYGGIGLGAIGSATEGLTLSFGDAEVIECGAAIYFRTAVGVTCNIHYVYVY